MRPVQMRRDTPTHLRNAADQLLIPGLALLFHGHRRLGHDLFSRRHRYHRCVKPSNRTRQKRGNVRRADMAVEAAAAAVVTQGMGETATTSSRPKWANRSSDISRAPVTCERAKQSTETLRKVGGGDSTAQKQATKDGQTGAGLTVCRADCRQSTCTD